jgi:hypothetical protein
MQMNMKVRLIAGGCKAKVLVSDVARMMKLINAIIVLKVSNALDRNPLEMVAI